MSSESFTRSCIFDQELLDVGACTLQEVNHDPFEFSHSLQKIWALSLVVMKDDIFLDVR